VFDAFDDLLGGPLALDLDRVDDDAETGIAALEDAEDVGDGRAARGGDDPDRPGPERQGLLAGRVEEAFGPELLLELFEGELEGALAPGFDDLDDDLVLAPGLVDAEPAAADDLEPVLEVEGDLPRGKAEHDPPELAPGILQGEIEVPRGVTVEVRDLPLDPDRGDGRLQGELDELGHFGDRVDRVRLDEAILRRRSPRPGSPA
jgi:hypothetical protein